ncbi:MAG: HAMP domain-containing protein, partial [Magnetovibrio sp.]|nr:HAMP domain-containing protein [Magnetovibrio sp.]
MSSHYFRGASLARRYLFSSLLIALLPLSLVAIFYDTLYVRALDQVVESQTNARLVSSENLLRTFLQERVYELQALVDQPGVSELLSQTSQTQLRPQAIDELFLQQLDSPFIYGVVFQRMQDSEPFWYMTRALRADVSLDDLSVTPIEEAEVLGPILPNNERPGWMVLRLHISGSAQNESGAWVGLVLRLTSFVDQIRDLELPGLQSPLLQEPGGAYLTPIGTVSAPYQSHKDVIGDELLPGWRIRLVWLGDPLLSPLEQARFGLILLAFAAGICVILLSKHLSNRINRQITPLIQGADRVASGDFDTPLDVEGTAEIGYLALAQERMRLRLKRLFRSVAESERRAVLGQFSAGVAHEIRNPLAIIKTTVQALSRKEEDPRRSELMEIIVHEIDRANDVVHLLLDYARPRD